MLIKGTDFPSYEPYIGPTYTLKRVIPSNSKNLIIGNTSHISSTQENIWNVNINSVNVGDKYCISCKDLSSLFTDGGVSFILIDDLTKESISNTIHLHDNGPHSSIFTITKKSDFIKLKSFTGDHMDGSVNEVMLVKGEIPQPWENNLGNKTMKVTSIKYIKSGDNLIKRQIAKIYKGK